ALPDLPPRSDRRIPDTMQLPRWSFGPPWINPLVTEPWTGQRSAKQRPSDVSCRMPAPRGGDHVLERHPVAYKNSPVPLSVEKTSQRREYCSGISVASKHDANPLGS